jgi:L-lactate dehydrogenase complex protein LldF
MGVILTTLLEGMEKAHPLLDATTLCRACGEVCPVKVPLPELLHRLREERVQKGFTPFFEQQGMMAFGEAAKHPQLFNFGQAIARVFWPVAGMIPALDVLERMPVPAQTTFGRRV